MKLTIKTNIPENVSSFANFTHLKSLTELFQLYGHGKFTGKGRNISDCPQYCVDINVMLPIYFPSTLKRLMITEDQVFQKSVQNQFPNLEVLVLEP